MNKYEIAKKYLDNEKFLLENWYSKTMAHEMGFEDEVEFKGTLPSLTKIREKFSEWVIEHKKNLHKIICKDFNYIEKRKDYEDVVDFIIAVSEALDFDYTNPIEVSTLLVTTVLDDFCQ
jgi:hypothetical protein